MYANEKLYDVVYELATGPGDVRSRLRNSLEKIILISENDLPGNLQADFKWVKEMLTRNNRKDVQGSLYDTLRKMQNSTGVEIAKKIVEIEDKLRDIIS